MNLRALALVAALLVLTTNDTISSHAATPSSIAPRLYFQRQGHLYLISVGPRGRVRELFQFRGMKEVSGIAISRNTIFWTAGIENAAIYARTPKGVVRRLVGGLAFPQGLVVARRHVYWLGQYAIGRVDLNGANTRRRWVVLPQESGGGVGEDIATDGRYLYVSRCQTRTIARVQLDGRGLDGAYIRLGRSACPQHLAYSDGFLYWTDSEPAHGFIGRVSVNAHVVRNRWVDLGPHVPYDLTSAGGNLFWVWGGNGGAPEFIGEATARGRVVTYQFINGDGPIFGAP
jgi:hypothetical protein